MSLIPVTRDNIDFYTVFEQNYNEHLKPYMSRIYPNDYDQYEKLVQQKMLSWNYIELNGDLIGSVWLEKQTLHERTATLGIFIYDPLSQGQGIGARTINHLIRNEIKRLEIDKLELRVRASNERAIRAYQRCGFKEVDSFIKDNWIKVIHMEKPLTAHLNT